MTDEKVKSICDLYYDKVAGYGPAVKMPSMTPVDQSEALRHVRWMALETKKFVDEKRTEKAMRWVGFMQGWLTAYGIYDLEDVMNHSRPAESTFDPSK